MDTSTSIPIVNSTSNPIETDESSGKALISEPVIFSISSRGRIRKTSKKLIDDSRLKKNLGFLGTIATYSLNSPQFSHAEYTRNHFKRCVSFRAKTLYHLEIVNIITDSTYNYIHPLSFATTKGDN